MSNGLNFGLLMVLITLILIIAFLLSKGKTFIKFAIIWFFLNIVIITVVIFPEGCMYLARMFGFQTFVNLIIGMLFLLILTSTILVDGQMAKINIWAQEISLLKEENKQNEK